MQGFKVNFQSTQTLLDASLAVQAKRFFMVSSISVFGRDVKAGETARARARLFIAVSPPENALREAYSAYLRGLSRTPSGG